ncbi:ATP-binding protein [Pseudonocardia eucalypti]|uniref:histidine kinase n=1 Tax=Pseudonocardia eucalypti TaxID=648755 RepID=A0ABP9QFS0_9PSEU|nr:signal transduction histidine kinase [Pseudonocardia eucalypti]
MPLKLRLTALFAVATALAIAVTAVLFLHQLRDNLDDTTDNELLARLSALTQQLAAGTAPPVLVSGAQLTQVQTVDGAVLASNASAAGFDLSPARRQQALAGQTVFTTTIDSRRTRILAATAPADGARVLVVVGAGTDIADDAVERVRAAFLILGPIAVGLAGLAAWLLAAAALRPVERMRQQTAAISAHDPERRLAVPGTRDEIAALGTTINELLDRLHDALERERRFVADAGHELRTPLAILRTELELAARPNRDATQLRQAIAEASQETERLIRLAEDLLLLARVDNHQPILRPTPVQLDQLLRTAARRGNARDHQPPVTVECPADLRITADADRLLQAVNNLLDNAIGHSPPTTPVALAAARRPDGAVAIEVTDQGPGLPPDFLPIAFERFQRPEHARSRDTGGTGLGLSIVRAISEAHGGSAHIDNRPSGGAVATIWLPATLVVG